MAASNHLTLDPKKPRSKAPSLDFSSSMKPGELLLGGLQAFLLTASIGGAAPQGCRVYHSFTGLLSDLIQKL